MNFTVEDLKGFYAGELDAEGIMSSLDKYMEMNIISRPFVNIFDTDYYWETPYKIDIEKYKQVYPETKLTDDNLQCVTFDAEIHKFGDNYTYSLFVNGVSQNKEPLCFDTIEVDKSDIDLFKQKIAPILDCIVEIDNEEMVRRMTKMEDFLYHIQTKFNMMVSIYEHHIFKKEDK